MSKKMATVKGVEIITNIPVGFWKKERPPIVWPPPSVKAPLVRIAVNGVRI